MPERLIYVNYFSFFPGLDAFSFFDDLLAAAFVCGFAQEAPAFGPSSIVDFFAI
jgi:hypothetical protein